MFELFENCEIHRKHEVFLSSTWVYLVTLSVLMVSSSSNDLKKFYHEGNWNKCVSSYLSLGLLLRGISSSQCTNILEYLKDVVQYWHKLLKSKLIV